MCGLFGFAVTPNFNRQKDLFDILAHFASFRGTHSWGVTTEHSDGTVATLRGLGDICDARAPQNAMSGVRTVLGHTRYATVGDISLRNAHPFDIKGILVAHNGGIWNHREIAKSDGRVYTVDSQALAWRVALGRDIDDLEGYGAVSWFDSRERGLRVSRMANGDLEMFVIRCRYTGGIAHVYISDSSSVGKTDVDLEDALSLFDFDVCDTFVPAEAVVYRVFPDRFEKEKSRRMELSEDLYSFRNTYRGGHDWSTWSDYQTEREKRGYDYQPSPQTLLYAYIDEEGDTILVRDINGYGHNKDSNGVAHPIIRTYFAKEWTEEGCIFAPCADRSLGNFTLLVGYDDLHTAFQSAPGDTKSDVTDAMGAGSAPIAGALLLPDIEEEDDGELENADELVETLKVALSS